MNKGNKGEKPMKTTQSELTRQDLSVGHVYKDKKKQTNF